MRNDGQPVSRSRTERDHSIASSPMRALVLSISLALATGGGSITASPSALSSSRERVSPVRLPSQTWTVKNCNDGGPDSLRDLVENPAKASSGDIVDLGELPVRCGMANATITLTTGQITINQDNLTLTGPWNGSVTISAGNASRVLKHQGAGTLGLTNLSVANGAYHSIAAGANGGCVYSKGAIYLNRSYVHGCTARSDSSDAFGGGISANSDVTMVSSRVSNNGVYAADQHDCYGGGISASGILAKYSSISGNQASGGPVWGSGGGGLSAWGGSATIFGTTIDHNAAQFSGALGAIQVADVTITNSTISGNVSDTSPVDVYGGAMTIANSTIAFNHSNSYGNAVSFFGPAQTSTFMLQSSIVADNTLGPNNTPADLYVATNGHATLAGADNLVVASNVSDPNVIVLTSDPRLQPLRPNGGFTRTHQLLPTSPAIGRGNNNANRSNEQRGTAYPRVSGPAMKVDIGAVQFDTIFASGLEFSS